MVITVIAPPVMVPVIIAPAIIPPVMATSYAHHDSRAVVNRRGRSVVDGRWGVVFGWGHDYRRRHTDADPYVNVGLRGYGEPCQQRRAEKKAPSSEFHVWPHCEMFETTFTATVPHCGEFFMRSPVHAAFLRRKCPRAACLF
jgi:hypothetical protein